MFYVLIDCQIYFKYLKNFLWLSPVIGVLLLYPHVTFIQVLFFNLGGNFILVDVQIKER